MNPMSLERFLQHYSVVVVYFVLFQDGSSEAQQNWMVVSNSVCHFHPENLERFSFWPIFFEGVETTN